MPVTGKRVHDARLVAVLKTHGIDHLLTFNSGDFALFTDISIVNPSTLATTTETFLG
jgi:predicted nucleic acid-binding protein